MTWKCAPGEYLPERWLCRCRNPSINELEMFCWGFFSLSTAKNCSFATAKATSSYQYSSSSTSIKQHKIFFICEGFWGVISFLMVSFFFLSCPVPSGLIGERLPIRYYLTGGMLASGLFTAMFGLGYFYNVHNLWFYIIAQVGTVLI